jgi:dephospho-CoA kinase
MFRIGLAGGIGSGKSEVARRLGELGAHVIEADEVARDIVAEGSPTFAEIVSAFGESVLTADGSLDRRALAERAFASRDRLERLNAITWPPLIAEIVEKTEQVEREDPDGVLVVDAALLVQWDILDLFDAVLTVTAPVEQRLSRLTRSGMSREDALARISAQLPESALTAVADTVIANDGTLEELRERVDRFWSTLPVAEEETQ